MRMYKLKEFLELPNGVLFFLGQCSTFKQTNDYVEYFDDIQDMEIEFENILYVKQTQYNNELNCLALSTIEYDECVTEEERLKLLRNCLYNAKFSSCLSIGNFEEIRFNNKELEFCKYQKFHNLFLVLEKNDLIKLKEYINKALDIYS